MSAPVAFVPPPGNPRFPLIDAVRGIAAGLIVLVHVSDQSRFSTENALGRYTAHLDIGVTLFFLLSGFLLYRPFVAARLQGRPPIRVRDYARRRVLRIVPAYWVALTLLALWPGLVGLWDGGWWRYYAFGQVYSPSTTLGGIGAAWSLCVEISFYVALPFLAAALGRLGRGVDRGVAVRREVLALGAVILASLALRGYVLAEHPGSTLGIALPVFMDWFALGMLLAVLSVAWHGREEASGVLRVLAARPWLAWLGAAVVYWAVCSPLGLPVSGYTPVGWEVRLAQHAGFALAALLLLLPAIFGDGAGGWPRRLLATRALGWAGLVSYGVFLYNLPLIGELSRRGAEGWLPVGGLLSLGVCALAAALAAGALSYYVVERPALRVKDRIGRGSVPVSSAGPAADERDHAVTRSATGAAAP